MQKNINAIYAQSGGVTPVINATACGVIETFHNMQTTAGLGKIYAAQNGIIGVLQEELIDLALEPAAKIQDLKSTPGGAFGSCRYKLKNLTIPDDLHNKADLAYQEYLRLIEVFKAHNIGYFFYNGGGDSQDTAYKIHEIAKHLNYELNCIGIPKTIDNDLAFTDNCPGFGSVAKYIAISTLEASLDLRSMAKSSTKVFILEVMGRNAGWIAASSALASNGLAGEPPQIILFPEIAFDQVKFCQKIHATVNEQGFAVIVASEGVKDLNGDLLSKTNNFTDQFGHQQLGGVAPILANLVTKQLSFKTHWAVADYLQRSARHIAAKVDVEQAYALGKAAVELAVAGANGVIPIIVRTSNHPYKWEIQTAKLADLANVEKQLPPDFITADGFGITSKCREYLLPLIQGEDYPSYVNGIPKYVSLTKHMVPRKLPNFIC